jgi:glycosyltransferase involved in cell wall biosynthesis
MRVGLLIYGDINTISGGYLYDRKLVEFLRHQGDEVVIVSVKKTTYLKALFTNTIPEELKNIKIDVLIQDELVHPSFWRINRKLKKILNCPIVSLVHLFGCAIPAYPPKKSILRIIEKRYLASVDALILNSKESYSQAESLLSGRMPMNLIANPCGDNFSEPKDLQKNYSEKGLKIFFVGNISRQKGLHVLIKALYQLNNKNISLSIVGREDIDSKYLETIRKYIEINKLDDQIKFHGVLHGDALREEYLDHDVFIMPSANEAYGIVFLEAMQFYMPVVGCSSGGTKEIIEDGVNGYLIDPEDSNRLAEIINFLDEDRSLLKQLSETSRQKYLQHPTWNESMNKIRMFLQEIISMEPAHD